MANQNISGFTATWNSGGTTFNGIKLNVTDAASAADSKLWDFQVGGSTKGYLQKDGALVLTNNDAGAGAGPSVILDRFSGSPAAADLLGELTLRGRDSGAAAEDYVVYSGTILDPTATSEDARAFVKRKVAGSFVTDYLDSQHTLAQGRLTLTSGTAVTVSDVTAAGTLYYTPYCGNRIWLYASSVWTPFIFSELSIALSGGTASRPHDVFIYSNSGVPTLEILAWTNDTTRATALTTQDGILVKSGDAARRYVGTIYADGSKQCEDSAARRWLWNMYNRRRRSVKVIDTTDNWGYTTATYRQVRGTTSNQFDMVRGLDEDSVEVMAQANASNSSAGVGLFTSIGLDSTSTKAADCISTGVTTYIAGYAHTVTARYSGLPGIGRHYLAWLELSSATGTTTWTGDGGGAIAQTGMTGSVFA